MALLCVAWTGAFDGIYSNRAPSCPLTHTRGMDHRTQAEGLFSDRGFTHTGAVHLALPVECGSVDFVTPHRLHAHTGTTMDTGKGSRNHSIHGHCTSAHLTGYISTPHQTSVGQLPQRAV